MAKSSSSTLLKNHGYWVLLLPPLFVYILANILFELSIPTNSSKFAATIHTHIASQDFSPLSFTLTEMKVRYIWFTTILVNLFVSLYVAALGGIIICQAHTGKRLITVIVVGTVLILIGMASLAYSSATQNAMFSLIYYFSLSSLQATGLYNNVFLGHVELLLGLTNILAIIVPCILLLAFPSTIAPSQQENSDELSFLTVQMRHLKGVLNAGSALLVTGILHMSAWLRWPTGLLQDPIEQSALSEAVLSITMFWGATFTLMLIATYGPAANYLSGKARILADQAQQTGTIQDSQKWLHDNHLSITLGDQLPQISAILGPVLAGPIGSFLMSHVNG